MGLFGHVKKDPKDQVKEIQRKLRIEMTGLKRQINNIEREEEKVKQQIKIAAKKGDHNVCVILAKSIIQSRKSVCKLHLSCTQINSIIMNIQHQLSAMRMAGSIQQSTDVMKSMQNLIKMPEIMHTMRELSKEMTKIGIMDEMIEETMDSIEPEEIEEQAKEEIENILYEVTAGELGKASVAINNDLKKEKGAASSAVANAFIKELESSKG